jgi:hypothetical protein
MVFVKEGRIAPSLTDPIATATVLGPKPSVSTPPANRASAGGILPPVASATPIDRILGLLPETKNPVAVRPQ